MYSCDPVLSPLPSSPVSLDFHRPFPTLTTAVLATLLVLTAWATHAKAQAFDPVAYQAAYTPTVSMTVSSDPSAQQTMTMQGGVSTQIPLPLSIKGQAATATFTLNYGSAWAGHDVHLQPMRGGTCTATGATGSATYHQGMMVTLDSSGSMTVTFQPPNRRGTYKVFTRLLNVSTTFPFVVTAAGTVYQGPVSPAAQ